MIFSRASLFHEVSCQHHLEAARNVEIQGLRDRQNLSCYCCSGRKPFKICSIFDLTKPVICRKRVARTVGGFALKACPPHIEP